MAAMMLRGNKYHMNIKSDKFFRITKSIVDYMIEILQAKQTVISNLLKIQMLDC